MGKGDLPTYDDHGLDADIKDVPLSTSERNARYRTLRRCTAGAGRRPNHLARRDERSREPGNLTEAAVVQPTSSATSSLHQQPPPIP